MKAPWLAVVFPALCLAACHKPYETAAARDAADDQGLRKQSRYQGIGIYHPGEMWSQISRADPPEGAQTPGGDRSTTPAAATLKDDDEVIVVVDNKTGELRQCGNLSGFCVGMNPWAKPLGAPQAVPLPLIKHAEELAADEAAQSKAEGEANRRALGKAIAAAKTQADVKGDSSKSAATH